MAKRRAAQRRVREAELAPTAPAAADDTALRSLTDEERASLGMDSWEPSLLRALLQAENRLPPKKR
jgi:hypothetical protein